MSSSTITSNRAPGGGLRRSAWLAVLLFAGCGGDAPLMSTEPDPNGAITIAGEGMSFVTSLCEPGSKHFAAVGQGDTGARSFVVVVKSPNVVTVAFDVTRELDSPPDDAPWYYAADGITLWADGARIVGDGRLLSVRDANADPVAVSLAITCRRVIDDRAAISPAPR